MKKAKKRRVSKSPAKIDQRAFNDILRTAVGNEWVTSGLSLDAETFQNVFGLRAAMRDLWRSNPYLAKYQEQLAANVFGEAGIMLRSKIKEESDRVVYAEEEKLALIKHEERINRLRTWAEKKLGNPIEKYRAFQLADALDRSKHDDIIRGEAIIKVGSPDVYANQRVEAWWTEWHRAKYCDVRGRRDYNTLRQLRLWSCARDGGHFIRLIKDVHVNRMGFAIQQVNDEWCDHFYNETLDNGNVVRMGIEYEATTWGIGKPVAFYFIKRIPRDWQTGARYGGGYSPPLNSHQQRDRVPAEEIIHYARFTDTESTRPPPWGISIIGKAKQLDMYEIAEVVAARAEACKTGWLWSDIVPEGGVLPEIDPTKAAAGIKISPGGLYGLPYGVKHQSNDPTHPSGNFQNFRQGMGQATCAGLPGADYNVIFNDLANINFSAGRLGRLDTSEQFKLLQRWDITTAEIPIFEAGLEMALLTGAIPLPTKKFAKFNAPIFQGRRWQDLDEIKSATAAALRVANMLSTRGRECAEAGVDFEDIAIEISEEHMLLESLGLDPTLTVQSKAPPISDPEPDDPKLDNPKPKKGANGKHLSGGGRITLDALQESESNSGDHREV